MSRQMYSECINMGVKSAKFGQVGGRYTPATATSAASFSTTLGVVNPKYRDAAGNLKDVPESVYITVFNSKNGGPAWADIYAKYLSKGKRLKNVILDRHQYDAQAKGPSGELLVKPDNTPFMIRKEGYTLLKAELGRDSSKLLSAEISAWMTGNGQPNFNSRPPFWNGCPEFLIAMGRVTAEEVKIGMDLWAQVSKARAATVYQPGMEMFGYAMVVVRGAALNVPVTTITQPFTGSIPGFGQHQPVPPTSMAGFAGANLPATGPAAPVTEGTVLGDEAAM